MLNAKLKLMPNECQTQWFWNFQARRAYFLKREKALHKDFNGANSGPMHAPEFLIKEAALHDDFNGANSGPQHAPGIITFPVAFLFLVFGTELFI